MKTIILILSAFVLLTLQAEAGGKCVGSSPCSACSNCSRCKYCSSGGKCGACSKDVDKPKQKKTKKPS